MSKAEELLDSLSIEDIQPFTSQPDIEGHIVIDKDRIIHVPTELKRIAVQYDANIETVTFDCPRYWDEHDLSEMNIYINYKLPSNLINNIGQSLVKNLRINEDDENIINFDWTIGPILTNNKGNLPFSVCAKSKTNQDSDEAIRWYTEINTELTISEGMDGSGDIEDSYEDLFPDIINDIISKLEGINATYNEKLETFNTNASEKTSAFNINASEKTQEFNDNVDEKTEQITSQLDNYVQFDNYPSNEKAGVIKSHINGFQVSENGNPNAAILSKEQYDTIENQYFISKGTLENIKDDYVGSSTPVQDLTSTVTNIQEEQDESKPKNTASGEMITVDDAIAYKIFNVTVDGASEQKTTTGKNKFDISSLINRTQTIGASTGNIYTLKPNTQYTVSTNMVSGNTDGSIAIIGIPQSVNAFIFVSSDTTIEVVSSSNHGVGTTNDITRTLMTDDTGNIFVGIREIVSSSLSDLISKGGYVQIEEGPTATSDEPYTGGQPSPSPDYPQPITTLTFDKITRCGKNLATENFANQNSSINLARTLKKGEKITIVVNMTATDNPPSGYGINIYDQDNEQLWGNSYTNWQPPYDGWNSFVVTVKNDTSILRINSYGYQEVEIPTAILSGALVEENKYIHDGSLYEPYQGQTYDIDLQGNEMVELPNSVKDELVVDKYGNVSLIKNIGKVILDGSENNWDWNMITEDEKYRFSTGVIQSLVEPSTPCLSNYFMSGSADDSYYFVENTIEIAPSGGITICTYAVSNSIEEFRAWLQEHNVIVYYQLANPQLIPLGKLTNLITTEEGINNFFINGNLETILEVLYALDIKKYIDNKLAEISAQLIKGE